MFGLEPTTNETKEKQKGMLPSQRYVSNLARRTESTNFNDNILPCGVPPAETAKQRVDVEPAWRVSDVGVG